MARRGREKGRVKIQWIMDNKKRNRTLKRRLPVVLKKARELAVLTDVPVCLVAYRPGEAEPVTWPSPAAAVDVVREYRAMPGLEKLKNKLDSTEYAQQMNDKVKVKVSKAQVQTREEGMKRVMVDFLAGRRGSFHDLPTDLFISVGMKVQGKRKAIHARLQQLRSAPAPPAPADVQMFEPLAMLPPPVPLQMVAAPLLQNEVAMTPMMVEPLPPQHHAPTPMTLAGEPRHGSYLFEVLDAFGDPGDGSALPSTEEMHAVFVQAGIFSPPLPNPSFNP